MHNTEYPEWHPVPCNLSITGHVICTNELWVKPSGGNVVDSTAQYVQSNLSCPCKYIPFKQNCFLLNTDVPNSERPVYTVEYDGFLFFFLSEIGLQSLSFGFRTKETKSILVWYSKLTKQLHKGSLKTSSSVLHIVERTMLTESLGNEHLGLQIIQCHDNSFISIVSLHLYPTNCLQKKEKVVSKETVLPNKRQNQKVVCKDLFHKSVKGVCVPFFVQPPCSSNCFMNKDKASGVSNNINFYTDCSQTELEIMQKTTRLHSKGCLLQGEIQCTFGCQKCFPVHKICVYELNQLRDLMHCPSGSHLKHCQKWKCANMMKCYRNYCIPYR